MILVTNLQLGLRDQTLLSLNDDGSQKTIVRTTIDSLPDAICGFYYGYDGTAVYLKGPKQICNKVADEVKDASLALYADREPINIIIEEY